MLEVDLPVARPLPSDLPFAFLHLLIHVQIHLPLLASGAVGRLCSSKLKGEVPMLCDVNTFQQPGGRGLECREAEQHREFSMFDGLNHDAFC